MRRSFILLLGLAIVGLVFAAYPSAGGAQTLDDPPAQQPPADGGSVNTVIPGFYSVGAFMTGTGPLSLDLDPTTGYLWVVDAVGDTVDVVSHDGTIVLTIGSTGSADGEFDTPAGVGILDGEAFVTDLVNARVQVFDTATGAHLRSFGTGVLSEPCGIAVTSTQVFVADATLDEIVIFTTTGTFIASFDGGANGPIVQTCGGDQVDVAGSEIYAVGPSSTIVVFDLTGLWLREFAVGPLVSAVQIDSAGQVWVTTQSDTVEVYSSTGVFVAAMDESGAALGQIGRPRDIVIDPSGDTYWVAEDDNDRVQAFTRLLCAGGVLSQVGTSFDDALNGTAGADTVALGPGADTYRGRAADDTVCAGTGNDNIRGGGGADEIWGEAGDDELAGQGGSDTVNGGPGADTIDGQGAADFIDGGSGDDTLAGQNGGDTIDGGPGLDTLRGNTGPDTMSGEGDDDQLFGGNGADELYGGPGIDQCSGNAGPDSAQAATCETTPGVETLF